MKRMVYLILALITVQLDGVALARSPVAASAPAVLRYLSPPDGSRFVQPRSTIALRLDGAIDPASLSPALFVLMGSASGPHIGQVRLADDGTTLIFQPVLPFKPGETVALSIKPGLATQSGAVFSGLRAAFSVSPGGADVAGAARLSRSADMPTNDADATPAANAAAAPGAVAIHPQDYVTFPHDFPAYTVTVPASGTAPGLLFLAPFNFGAARNFLFIGDDTGEPVYWQGLPLGVFAHDFKRQPNGSLTYFSSADNLFHMLDNTYSETTTFAAGNGYLADLHDLQLLPNGHALLMIYDPEPYDTSALGGYVTATVSGLVIQELDITHNVVFQWTSWDHFLITDTTEPLTTPFVDYVHANAIERDNDGNLLLSSRHLDEITKIDRNTGNIIWRWGGKNNQFTFVNNPDGPFYHQHDIRRLPNGNVTLFDNHNPGPFSRAVEFALNENAHTATNVWQYRNSPDDFAFATGNAQRLPDGPTLIGWGFGVPNVTEVLTDGSKLFELTIDGYTTYRAFRFPWAATPAWDPTLVLVTNTVTSTLYYSWNGATDIAYYQVYGSLGSQPVQLLRTQPRTGFEDHTELTGLTAAYCAFWVRPIDHQGQPQRFSNVVYTRTPCTGYARFLPVIFGP